MAKGQKKGKRLANPPDDKATKAVQGQLATAADMLGRQIGKQQRKLDRQTDKTLHSMSKLVDAQRRSGQRLVDAALAERASYGVAGSAVSNRVASAERAATHGVVAAQAQRNVTSATKKAGYSALNHAHRSGVRMNKNSMSLLNVLAAQKESEFQHEILMQQLGFDQSVALATLQNNLQKDYLDYQYEQGYAETPDEKRREDWEYRKKELKLSTRLASNDADKAAFSKWDGYNTQVSNAVVDFHAIDEAEWATAVEAATAKSTADGIPVTDHLTNILTPGQEELPEGIDRGVISAITKDMIENRLNGVSTGKGPASGPGWAPNFETVKSYIQSADTDGSLSSYMERKGKVLMQAHQDYKAIRAVTTSAEKGRNAAASKSGGTPWGLYAAGAAGLAVAGPKGVAAGAAGIGKVGGGIGRATKGVAGAVANNYGAGMNKYLSDFPAAIQHEFAGLTAPDLVGVRSAASQAASKAAVQSGVMSMFHDVTPAGPGGVTAWEMLDDAYAKGVLSEGEWAQAYKLLKAGTPVKAGTSLAKVLGTIGLASTDVGMAGFSLLERFNPEKASEFSGRAWQDSRGIVFKYDDVAGGTIMDVDSAFAHYWELTDEEKDYLEEYLQGRGPATETEGPVA